MKNSRIALSLFAGVVFTFFSVTAMAVPVTINTGSYAGLWDIDFDGNFVSGPQVLDLDTGTHWLRTGTYGAFGFSVDAVGQVTLAAEYDGISANGGIGELNILTIPVTIDPDAYAGNWEIGRVRDSLSGYTDFEPGIDTVQLVPTEATNQDGSVGGQYRLAIGDAGSALTVNLRADGSMTFSNSSAVFDDGGTLRFHNTTISVTDRDATEVPWYIRQVSPNWPTYEIGSKTQVVVPEIVYLFQANSASAWFTVSEPCAVSPSVQDMAGVFFDVTCAGSEVITVQFSGTINVIQDGDGFLAGAGVVNGDLVEGHFSYDTATPPTNESTGLSQYWPNDYSFTIGGNKVSYEWPTGCCGSGIVIRDSFSTIGDMFQILLSGDLVNTATGETHNINSTNSWVADNTGTTWDGTALPTFDVLTNLIDPALNPSYQSFARMQGTNLDYTVQNFTMTAEVDTGTTLVLDQENVPEPLSCSTTLGATIYEPPAFAQTLTVGATGTLSSIESNIYTFTDYDAGPLTIEIRNVVATTYQGQPVDAPGPNILGSKSIAAADIPLGLTYYPLDVSEQNISVAAGEKIAIVWTRNAYSGSGGQNIVFGCSGGTVGDPVGFYAGGRAFTSIDQLSTWKPFNSWIDFRFRTWVSVGDSNEPPTADAGLDGSIRSGDTVYLDGSASFDDNTATANLLYSWTFSSLPAGSTASLSGANTAAPNFVADLNDTYIVQLVVTDEAGLPSIADEVVISSDNLAPTSVAGDDQLVVVGTLVNLDGSNSSDPEMDALTYAWMITSAPTGSAAVLAGASTDMPSFVSDLTGTFAVSLVVSDLIGPGAPDTVEITAASAGDFGEVQIALGSTVIVGLSPSQVTTGGNQNALLNFLSQAVVAIQAGDLATAIDKLEKALIRTDGCVLRGSPDGNGPSRDWITDCPAQIETYNLLNNALVALTP